MTLLELQAPAGLHQNAPKIYLTTRQKDFRSE
jgi:hypothetical protein